MARLSASKAGKLVAQAIEAHGGLEAWLRPGTIAFTFDYRPLGAPARRMHTHSRVDLWRSRAVHEERGEGADARFGFNGSIAWIVPGPEAFPITPRFWATTPYYFVGIPFVLADPGVRFAQLKDGSLDGETYHIVKATFEAGTGDSPDDYYVLYIHPRTFRVGAIRYIVAYPGMFEPGQHSPEKLMRYDDQRQVDGLWFAHRLDTYRWGPDGIGEKVTEISVSEVGLGAPIPGRAFEPPVDAHVTKDL